jgi:hypothetical protein
MPDWLIITIIGVVLVGVTAYLVGSLIVDIRRQRRTSGIRRLWRNFGLSIAFCVLFVISWSAQGFAEWGQYRQDQRAHGQPVSISGFVVAFGQSTLENWQSEFLQLFSFVVVSSLLIHRGSAESKDSDDRIEAKLDEITRRLDELVTQEKA